MVPQPPHQQSQGSTEIIWSEIALEQWMQFLSSHKRGRPVDWTQSIHLRLQKALERLLNYPRCEIRTNKDSIFAYPIVMNEYWPYEMKMFCHIHQDEPPCVEVLAIMKSHRSNFNKLSKQ